jgi:hypothetical protein
MDYKEQILNYLFETEETIAYELFIDSNVQIGYIDIVEVGLEDWEICSFQILIRGVPLKNLNKTYKEEKLLIEQKLREFAETEKKSVQGISWLPLPKILSSIAEYNRNDEMKKWLVHGNYDDFFTAVKSIFASLSYNMKITEAYFHSNIHILLSVFGLKIVSEDETNIGRIDSVIEFPDKIIILEFKTSTATIALSQIKEKKYFEKYLIIQKKLHLIGVACSLKERNISDWKVEEIDTSSNP